MSVPCMFMQILRKKRKKRRGVIFVTTLNMFYLFILLNNSICRVLKVAHKIYNSLATGELEELIMATHTNYNDFGATMLENRPTMEQFESEEMSRNEWKKYLRICDELAESAYNYMGKGNTDGFADFRNAVHALFTFVGMDTRILAIDGYTVRFIPAVVPYKVMKSTKYKDTEKSIRNFKKAKDWACEVSNADSENPDDVLFANADSVQTLVEKYFTAEHQNDYNLCVGLFKVALAEERNLTVADLNTELSRLESIRDELKKEDWQLYKDWKDPFLSSNGKTRLKHVPASIRKNIENCVADIITSRTFLSVAQLEKEHDQIKNGRQHTGKKSKKTEATTNA